MFLDKEGNVIKGKRSTKSMLAMGIPRIAGVLQFIKLGSLPMKIETRNRIGGTWRYSHTKTRKRLNS
jgi:hypothetical protein